MPHACLRVLELHNVAPATRDFANVLVLVPQAAGNSVVRAGEETLRESQSGL